MTSVVLDLILMKSCRLGLKDYAAGGFLNACSGLLAPIFDKFETRQIGLWLAASVVRPFLCLE